MKNILIAGALLLGISSTNFAQTLSEKEKKGKGIKKPNLKNRKGKRKRKKEKKIKNLKKRRKNHQKRNNILLQCIAYKK